MISIKMNRIIYMLFTAGLLFFSGSVKAQKEMVEEKAQIALMPRTANDSIVLRWLTSDAELLSAGIDNGYLIKRSDLENGKWSKYKEVATVKTWAKKDWDKTLNQFKDTNSKEYRYFKMAYELVINRNKYLPTDISDFSAIQMAKAQNDLMFLFSILASCNDRVSSEAMGLRWVDKTVTPGMKYKYSIELKSPKEGLTLDPTEIETETKPYQTNAQAKLTAIENEVNITLHWLIAEEPLIGYSLERSQDGGKSYTRLNSEMIMINDETDSLKRSIGTLADTMVKLYVPYVYRIVGHTLFADEVVVGTIEAMARDRTPFSSIFVPSPEPTGEKVAVIKWELTGPPRDLAGFNVLRDNSTHGTFSNKINNALLSPNITEFRDVDFSADQPNYYIIETIDTAGNMFRSNPVYLLLVDSIPPTAPVWSSATMDSNGVVTLRIKLNREKDFMGYRIQKANQADHEFSTFLETYERNDTLPKTGSDSVFTDTVTLNTLTRNIYYKVYALDFHYNQSAASKIIKVARPDIIPPVAPVLKRIVVSDSFLQLKIIPSSSEDAKNTKVWRKTPFDSTLVEYAVLSSKDTVFTDSSVETSTEYEYALQAVDSSNLVSDFSLSIAATPYDNGLRKGIENFEVVYNEDFEKVMLSWNYSFLFCKPNERVFFTVYRTSPLDSNVMESYKSFEFTGDNTSFQDDEIKSGKTYSYAVKILTDIGAESLLSETRKVAIINTKN
ncbi:MAG: hypothetical protein GC181_10220 [Bacteroidetes bacterium]|nr:hypothetical protein [Bacteroidota bacterium]